MTSPTFGHSGLQAGTRLVLCAGRPSTARYTGFFPPSVIRRSRVTNSSAVGAPSSVQHRKQRALTAEPALADCCRPGHSTAKAWPFLPQVLP